MLSNSFTIQPNYKFHTMPAPNADNKSYPVNPWLCTPQEVVSDESCENLISLIRSSFRQFLKVIML